MAMPSPRLSPPRSFDSRPAKREAPRTVNVQVAVRCRPLNEREINAGEHAALVCPPGRDEVVLTRRQTGQRHQSYAFDHVFGPASSQEEVYKKLLEPIVQDVLNGYNCTVFAYGQTGTGKTHTMEGWIENITRNASMHSPSSTRPWNDGSFKPLPAEAGMIPRAAHQVFSFLRNCAEESSVRVSHLEIYNENLSDLMNPNQTDDERLRMFEDTNGTMVHALKETIVRSETDICLLLEDSAFRRRTAETKLNRHSSRSHAVFTITVHRRENSPNGQELVKIGKLHLVDLAGSENISRSGAVKGQAREAGNINQSLLTLGRVITALVEKHPHVPYRDSKLTRLLQESLGGRNKTCLIATITAAGSVFEETISTLDYAKRAKKITNRPILNAHIAKAAMLKVYEDELIKLRKELDAQRNKDGVFSSPEEFKSLQEQAAECVVLRSAMKSMQEKYTAKTVEIQQTANVLTTSVATQSEKVLLALRSWSDSTASVTAENYTSAEHAETKYANQEEIANQRMNAAQDEQQQCLQEGTKMLQSAQEEIKSLLCSLTAGVDKMQLLCREAVKEQIPSLEKLVATQSSKVERVETTLRENREKHALAEEKLKADVKSELARDHEIFSVLKTGMLEKMSDLFDEYESKLATRNDALNQAMTNHAEIQNVNAENAHNSCVADLAVVRQASEDTKRQTENALGVIAGRFEDEAAVVSRLASDAGEKTKAHITAATYQILHVNDGREKIASTFEEHLSLLSILRAERLTNIKSANQYIEVMTAENSQALSASLTAHNDAVRGGLEMVESELSRMATTQSDGDANLEGKEEGLTLASVVSARLNQAEQRAMPLTMPAVRAQELDDRDHARTTVVEANEGERFQPPFVSQDIKLSSQEGPDYDRALQDVTNVSYSGSDLNSSSDTESVGRVEKSDGAALNAPSTNKPTGLKPPARRGVQSRRPIRQA